MLSRLETFEELLPLFLMFGVLLALLAIFQRKLGGINAGRAYGRLDDLPFRIPGASVLDRFDRTTSEFTIFAVAVAVVPLTLLVSYLAYLYLSGKNAKLMDMVYLTCLLVGFLLYGTHKLRRLDAKKKRLQRVYTGLQMVAQEINGLMSSGYQVYHDFPSGRFHIDHIIVGPNGVFTIQSRIPSCFDGAVERRHFVIKAMGKELRAAKTTDAVSIRTTAIHAAWLANWLLTAAGEAVRVQPLLTLPGFTIDAVDTADVIMADPARIVGVVRTTCVNPLTPETIQRLCAEIEIKYRREVSPKSDLLPNSEKMRV